jgi:hypothetical protein
MVDASERSSLAHQALPFPVGRKGAASKHFDGNLPLEAHVERSVHFAGSSRPNLFD